MKIFLVVLLSAVAMFSLYMSIRCIVEHDPNESYETWRSKVLHFWRF